MHLLTLVIKFEVFIEYLLTKSVSRLVQFICYNRKSFLRSARVIYRFRRLRFKCWCESSLHIVVTAFFVTTFFELLRAIISASVESNYSAKASKIQFHIRSANSRNNRKIAKILDDFTISTIDWKFYRATKMGSHFTKVRKSKKNHDQIIDVQNAWNKSFKKQQDVWNEFLKTHVDMITNQIDDFKNEFKSSFDALSQNIIHTQNRINEFFAENKIVMNNLTKLIQQQLQRFSRFASSKKRSRFDKTYDIFVFRFFFVESLILSNSKKKKKISKVKYRLFQFTCFETHDKNDYVIISDKIHYRNV